ncbi:sulfatase [Alienimonas chondri]|uniref:Arylsulfatase n=1 Tax=Alienimonas chondri TaxID=2681879 RepID=A0ABX1VHS1_9PLAN|nr:sulfatase [Alienimonas chondri]NNJ27382.1 Arylsulfatase [Alienimonas chondri]
MTNPPHAFFRLLALWCAAPTLLAGFAGFGQAAEFAPADESRPPNVVFVFADDLGWKDVGYQSDGFFETPHLDRLAEEGMTFTNAYATAGNCAPSRACLLSGTYTPRHHVFAVGSTDRGPRKHQRLIPIPNRSGLPAENVTMAEAMKAAGYATGHFGKWHLLGKDGALPTEQGFDVSYNSYGEGPTKEGWQGNKPGPPTDPKGVFSMTDRAVEFMTANRDRPFFCYLAHHAIHTPLQAQTETLAKFKAKQEATPDAPAGALYAAMTADLDESVGRLMQSLDDLGLAENTLVVFTSDNGATPASSQEPLRGNKGGYYEGGIREPCVACWPGVIEPGSVCDTPITNVDFYPTFVDVAGAQPPAGKVLDGESLLPLFQGGNLQREAIFWHFPGYLDRPVTRGRPADVALGFRTRPVSVIRKGDWKLHLFLEEWTLDGGRDALPANGAVELYDLSEDIGERNDLSQSNPQKRDELLNDLLAWFDAADAPLPTERNPKYIPGERATPK